MRPRDWVFMSASSAVIGLCAAFGASYVLGGGWPAFYLGETLGLAAGVAIAFAGILFLVDAAFGKIKGMSASRSSSSQKRLIYRLVPEWSINSIGSLSLLMLLLWMPWFVANFPGGTYWDTYYQIFQVYPENHPIAVIPWAEIYNQTLTDAWLVDHHPVFTTLVYGAFGWVSDQLTGNWMCGVALFCILQGLLHTIAFTASIAYLNRIGCPRPLCLAAYLFFAIMPFISTWAMCMVKDSFFGLFLIPYFMMAFESVRTRGRLFSKPRNILLFAFCALGLCLTKKTGLFVVVITGIVAILSATKWLADAKPYMGKHASAAMRSAIVATPDDGDSLASAPDDAEASIGDAVPNPRDGLAAYLKAARDCRKAFAIQAVACAAVMLAILPYAVFPALNIQAGGLQETLGPMFQQTARAVVDHEDTMTEEEKSAISAVLDYDKLARQYSFDFEDSVKYRYNLDATPSELADYMSVYIEQGLRYPDSYFGAIMSLAGFYVAPCAFINIRMVTVDTKMGPDDRHMLWNPDELDAYRLWLDDAYKAIAEVPVLDIPLLIVTYALWLPTAMAYVAFRRRIGIAIILAPLMVLLAFCIIAPVYDARYVVPILDCAPLLVCAVASLIARGAGKRGPNVRLYEQASVRPNVRLRSSETCDYVRL